MNYDVLVVGAGPTQPAMGPECERGHESFPEVVAYIVVELGYPRNRGIEPRQMPIGGWRH
jgi:hypothetical protein